MTVSYSSTLLCPVIVCADDYALSPGVARGIREAIAAGALSATGCMTVSPYWPQEAPALADLAHRADIGLHLTLTDHRPLGAMPFLAPNGRLPSVGKILALALMRRLPHAEIAAEIERQLDLFEAHWHGPPDFIDGHHHVHQLPIVREALIAAIAKRYPQRRPWVRSCFEPVQGLVRHGGDLARGLIITQLGRGLDRMVREGGLVSNRGFRGLYDYGKTQQMQTIFAAFFARPDPAMLVMCHPGYVDEPLRAVDSLLEPRQSELAFLLSDEFRRLIDHNHIVLSRLSVRS